jgi:hypothetical protein
MIQIVRLSLHAESYSPEAELSTCMEGLALAIQQSSLKNAKIMLNSSLLSRRRRTVTHLVTEINYQAWCGRIGASVKVLKIVEALVFVWLIFLALGKGL